MLSLKRPYYPIATITLIQQTCVVQSIKSVGQRKVVHRILILGQHQSRCIVLQAVDKIGKCCPRIGKTKKNVKVWTSRISGCQVSAIYQFYCYRTWVRSLHWLPLSVTHWLTDCCLVDLIDLTLACEDGNSKLVEVVTVADVDAEEHGDGNLVQIWKLKLLNFCFDFEHMVWSRFWRGHRYIREIGWCLVEVMKFNLALDSEARFSQDFEV